MSIDYEFVTNWIVLMCDFLRGIKQHSLSNTNSPGPFFIGLSRSLTNWTFIFDFKIAKLDPFNSLRFFSFIDYKISKLIVDL